MSELATIQPTTTQYDLLAPGHFEHTQRVARMFASSQFVPQHFKGNIGDCTIAYAMSVELGVSPLTVMQNLYVVQGTPSFSSKFAIAMANSRGPFAEPINYEETGSGSTLKVRAFAPVRGSGTVREFSVDMAMANGEGWTKNPKYKHSAPLMLRYRAAAFLIRTTCPEVMMGLSTQEEVEDMQYSGRTTVVEGEMRKSGGVVETLNAELVRDAEVVPAHDPSTGELSPAEEAMMDAEVSR